MLDDLKRSRLEVVKVDGLRIVNSVNPEWYQRFCATYTVSYFRRRGLCRHRFHFKKRTFIKRCHTIETLRRIANGEKLTTVYADRLQSFIEEQIR